ncbi:glycerol-3-phosphate dehydrogenase [Amorphus sp. 3PC139-8]|uniref:glycerol-3-phosphate dehydrogenase n=1 Tax=Amorphus sp. 3PC139-8 TaxID=2735676 RepID=UPI00345DF214
MVESYDLAVIGGGVNGVAIARDAAGRGLTVFLAERADLAGATSSASTKLIHGGLRYLEQGAFRLVREALHERDVLLKSAPHIIWPLRFVLPVSRGGRPFWMLRLGLAIYDRLGGETSLAGTKVLDLRDDVAGAPLSDPSKALEYSDCWVDDARLVVLLARDAADLGARIATRTPCVSAKISDGRWRLRLEPEHGRPYEITASALVNAAGPWVDRVEASVVGDASPGHIRLVRGSHIVVRRALPAGRAYILQNVDRRIVFAIPYEGEFTLIGTTDVDVTGDPAAVAAPSEEEIAYLLDAVNRHFTKPITRSDVHWSYGGVRPLYDDGAKAAQSATRDYVLALAAEDGAPAQLNIYGGKITTFRRLAEHALERLKPHLPAHRGPWTASAPLPGGDFSKENVDRLRTDLKARYPFLAPKTATRLVRSYGTLAYDLLGEARSADDLGRCFCGDLSEREVGYLVEREFAMTAEDILWRRSKLGLWASLDEAVALDTFLGERRAASPER